MFGPYEMYQTISLLHEELDGFVKCFASKLCCNSLLWFGDDEEEAAKFVEGQFKTYNEKKERLALLEDFVWFCSENDYAFNSERDFNLAFKMFSGQVTDRYPEMQWDCVIDVANKLDDKGKTPALRIEREIWDTYRSDYDIVGGDDE